MPTGKPKKDNPAVYASSAPNKDASSIHHSNPSTHSQNQLNDFLASSPGLGKEADFDDQDLKGILAHRFLSALLDDVIIDTAFEAHKKETKKRRSACPVCNSSSCRSIASGSSSSTPQPQPQSQPSTSSQPSTNDPPSSAPEDISSTSAESQATQPSQETAKSVAETNGNGNLPSTSDAASTSNPASGSQVISTSTDSLAVPNSASAPQSQTSTPALSTPPPSQPTASTSAPSSTIKPTTNGTSNPVPTSSSNTTDYYSHNPLFECLVCSRQVSSNRYAPHLAKCLGLGSNSSSKTSSSRKSKGSDSSAAALAFSRGQKVASALENRKRAMGMSPSLGSGSSARNSPVPSLTDRGGTADSDDEPLKNSTDQSKKKTLGDSLGLSLNKYGKRALSPNFGVGKGNWKRNKNKTATPPPSSVGASGSQDSGLDPNSSTGMVRSHSANTPLSSVSSSQPFSHSPLNPNKYNNSANGKEAESIKEGDNVSPSKVGHGDGASGSNETLNSGHLGGDEEMEDFGDSPGPRSGSGFLNNGKNRKKLGKEGYSDEDSSMLSNSNSFSSAEGTSASEADEPTSSEEESSDDGENDLDDESPSESSQPRGRVGATYGRNSKKKSNTGTAGAGAGVMLERSRGSDGEFIGVDSASEQEDDDDDF